MVDVSIPAPDKPGTYFADTVILYGVKLNDDKPYADFDAGENAVAVLRMQLYRGGAAQEEDLYSIVLAYGYAYEGHCYRMDSKRIFIVKGPDAEPAVGCGFDSGKNAYSMWRIGSSEQLLEVSVNCGDTKKLILDANLPGRRSPSSYAITASLAHRDGRLNRD